MQKPIFLSRPSHPTTKGDLVIARDLADTPAAHTDHRIGPAANMIKGLLQLLQQLLSYTKKAQENILSS